MKPPIPPAQPHETKKNVFIPLGNFNIGRPARFTPEELLIKAEEYRQWCLDNPLYEEKAFGTGYVHTVSKLRAMSLQGFWVFIGLHNSIWYEYSGKSEYQGIIAHIQAMMFSQKFEGAAAGFLDSNIIARELQLTDKSDGSGVSINVNVLLPGGSGSQQGITQGNVLNIDAIQLPDPNPVK
jgi:hypothetical protein